MGIRGLRLTRRDGDKGAKTTEEGWGQWSSDYREGRGAEGLRLQIGWGGGGKGGLKLQMGRGGPGAGAQTTDKGTKGL